MTLLFHFYFYLFGQSLDMCSYIWLQEKLENIAFIL